LPVLVFLAVTGWTLVQVLRERPEEGWLGLAIVVGGGLVYAVLQRFGLGARANSTPEA
jgi:hypothetical protein